ncbi:MAG: oligosaccharide flippase family protein [Candidatus Marinimicrobia bacterium]|jgi:O-antigen/teichoic acid export membrane protein|nr:oligosaccharide flippase family protein [Candidatus Neomarinimicrobiota bacterium]MBT3618525.1 oligosaccharide flippase family protein [Candidatus Neomarinimicrobiota bacterium]MBT3828931.1 oligosaccharide flippase family protein [Candidatus Neomarinimicrobiota bacterium]MBT3997315.1 oligosaccharide flippase family protein [Candidatus Neomarinimicrobiota bacterium]MBT4281163.1 oligosaccharide flippase family protein [Candidatus Neomarinimicrobiota bacterium]
MKFKLIHHIGGASILVILGSLASFGANVILGRSLPQDAFGTFSLFRSVMFYLPIFAFLGFGNALIRFSRENEFSNINWKLPLRKMDFIAAGVLLLAVLVIQRIYPFSFIESMLLGIAAWLFARSLITNSILRIMRKMVLGQFTSIVWRYIFFIFLVVAAIWFELQLEFVLILFFLSFVVMFVIAKFIDRNIQVGKNSVRLKKIFDYGSTLFVINIITILMTQMDKLIVSMTLGTVSVGIYTGVSLVALTVFNLAGTTIGNVLMPHLAQGKRIQLIEFLLYFFIIPVFLIIFAFLSIEQLNTILFDGKYSGFNQLLQLSIVLGLMQYYHNLIEFSLGGLSSERSLKLFLGTILFSLLLLFVLSFILVAKHGLVGIIMGCIVAWLFRNFVGAILLGKILIKEKVLFE